MISKIVAWLSKRFPETLVVSKQDYTELRQEVAELNRYTQGIIDLNNRLTIVESQMKRLNDSNGFTTVGNKTFKLER